MTKKKILIVEDETALLYALQAKLSVENFDVTGTTSAEDAVNKLKKNKFDLIVLDVLLPGMDGFEFLKKLKFDEETKNISVIILTNLSDKESQSKGASLGAKEYILKLHFPLDEIVSKIKKEVE